MEKVESIVPVSNRFDGSVTDHYALEKLKHVKSASILTNLSAAFEDELESDVLLEDYDQVTSDLDETSNKFPEECLDSSDNEDCLGKLTKQKQWYVSKLNSSQVTEMHIKRAIKILLPREYVSRERSRRHIAANYLPGHQPTPKNHNVQKYRYFIVRLGVEFCIAKVIFLEENGKAVFSCSSDNTTAKFRAVLFTETEAGEFSSFSPMRVTRWLNVDRIFSEVHLTKISSCLFELNEDSRRIFWEAQKNDQISQDASLAKARESIVDGCDFVEVEDVF